MGTSKWPKMAVTETAHVTRYETFDHFEASFIHKISRQKISSTNSMLEKLVSPCIVKGREITEVIFCADIPCPLF